MTGDMAIIEELYQAILTGDNKGAMAITQRGLDEGTDLQALIDGGMIPAMAEVGRRFEEEEYFVPELLLSARAMKAALGILRPLLSDSGVEPVGCVVMGTVQGDLHDIGKNMVGLMLKVNGFEVIDLGTNVPPADIIARAEQEQVDIIGMSALLTTCLPYMKDVCDFLEAKGIRDKYPVIIGGAATHPEIAEEMGANTHGGSAAEGVEKCKMLLGKL
jgi:5-methyltetrahydrofolate--homocysteine methyltransferase